jgi:HAE1 family hydrophobic/amphiphilic exporter-1
MYQLSVRARRPSDRVSQFEDVVVKSGSDGALVRVKDIGRVELGAESYSSRLRFAGSRRRASASSCCRTANAIAGVHGRAQELERCEKNFPPGLKRNRLRQRRRRARVDHRSAEDAG